MGVALDRIIRRVWERPWIVGLISLLIAIFSVAGVGRLEVETDFTRNFRADSPIVESYEFIESHLGGAGVLDILLPAPPRLDWNYLERVLKLEQRLRDEVQVESTPGQTEPGLTKVLSLADTLVAASPTHPANVPIEGLRQTMITTGWDIMKQKLPAFSEALYASDPDHPGQWWFRILARAKERQPAAQKIRLIAAIERIVDEELADTPSPHASNDPEAGTFRAPAAVTGYFVLLTNMIASTVSDQWLSFAIASGGVALVLLVAFRNPLWVVVALIPNALPIFLVLGTLGWLNLKMNLGVAMIAAVSMGLSVDSSIHYLTAFRRRRIAGDRVVDALAAVQQSVGRAMVFSTLALVVGFTVLSTSQFVPTIYFGWLVSLAMLGGLAGNLVVLPLLVAMISRDE